MQPENKQSEIRSDNGIKTIQIFLASSFELADDRKAFEENLNRQDERWLKKGIHFKLVHWEDHDDTVSDTSKQNDYNESLKQCDLLIVLYWTKMGKYTKEEFEQGYTKFKSDGKPRILVYEKTAPYNPGSRQDTNSKHDFIDRLKEIEHFPTKYENADKFINHLNTHLTDNYDKAVVVTSVSHTPIYLSPTRQAPLPANKVIGRQTDLDSIEKAFNDGDHLLLLNGMGGVGKSTLAGYFMERMAHRYRHIGWVRYTGNLANDCARELTNYDALGFSADLRNQFDRLDPETKFDQLVQHMERLPGPNLLIVDNLNTIDDAEDCAARSGQFPHGWKLLITAREHNDSLPHHNVGVLSLEDARRLFLRHCSTGASDGVTRSHTVTQLDDLLEQVGHHTLVVEFLAKTTAAQGWTPEKMLDRLREKGLIHLDTKAEVATSHSKNQRKNMVAYISALFDINLNTLNENERWLLANLAMLPHFAHAFSVLEEMLFFKADWLEKVERFEKDYLYPLLNDLTAKGYLEKHRTRRPTHPNLEDLAPEEDGFYIHPVMAELLRDKEQPDAELCREIVGYFIDKFHNHDNSKNPSLAFSWLVYGEMLANFLPEHVLTMMLIGDMSWVLWQKNEINTAKEWLTRTLSFQEKTTKENPLALSAILNNLSLIYKYQGDLDTALKWQLENIEIKKKYLNNDHSYIATAYNNLSLIYEAKGDLQSALEIQQQTIAIREAKLEEYHPDRAQSYHNLAGIYKSLGQLSKAVRAEKKAIIIREKALGENHPLLALSLATLAALLDEMNQSYQALPYIEQAVAIYHRNFPQEHPQFETALKWLTHIRARATT